MNGMTHPNGSSSPQHKEDTLAGKKASAKAAPVETAQPTTPARKPWVKLTPRDHVLKQIEAQRELVESLRNQLEKEEKTLEGMEKAKEFFPA